MDELTTPIKETYVGEIRITTIYMENLHDFMQTLLEEVGNDWTPEAQALKATREEAKQNPELTHDMFGIPMFGPYYETMVHGGKMRGCVRKSTSVTEAMEIHADMEESVRINLGGEIA